MEGKTFENSRRSQESKKAEIVRGNFTEGNLVGAGVLVKNSNTTVYLKINKFKQCLRLEKKNSQIFKKIICQDQHCQEQHFLKGWKIFKGIHTPFIEKRARMRKFSGY